MKRWLCATCGYIIESENPKICPICNSNPEQLIKLEENQENHLLNDYNSIGIAKEADESITNDLRNIFSRECLEVGMYLAMSSIAHKEGYSKISKIYKKIAYEEANHAAVLAELLGEVVKSGTKDNLEEIIKGEYEAAQSKLKLAKKAKELGLETIYTALNTMCKEEAKHGKEFISLQKEFFIEE